MADYRTRRIENLRVYATETYKALPEECRKMSMGKFSEFLEARVERLASIYEKSVDSKEKIDYEKLRKENAKSFDFLHVKNPALMSEMLLISRISEHLKNPENLERIFDEHRAYSGS